MKVYLSHLGEPAFQAVNQLDIDELSLGDILREMEKRLPGTLALICTGPADAPKLKPHVAVYTNVQYTGEHIYDSEKTKELKNAHMDESLGHAENLLISIFDPERFGQRFLELMQDGRVPELKCTDENGKEYREKEYRSYFSEDVKGPIIEEIYRFRDGEVTLGQLLTDRDVEFVRNPNATDGFTAFDRSQSRVLPKQIVNALVDLWDLPNAEARLRRFQEDSLFYILGKLRDHTAYEGDALLLSIPTGGGKTEAFTIPLIAHVVDEKQQGLADARVRAVITYPTKALANDQARRLVEIIHRVNQEISDPSQKVTIGVLTGDTPRDYRKKGALIVQCPACGQAALEYVADPSVPKVKKIGVCKACQARMDYFRVTRSDILESPPDILITNPDMINVCLQDSLFGTLFRRPIDVIVFDEVHLCDGIFGCNVAHLLRRLEESSNHKPLYVGISATIQNAKALAALIFDVADNRVEYLHDRERFIDEGVVERYRYHFSVVPHRYLTSKGRTRSMRVLTAVLNLVDMLGHSVRDPHLRKTLVFANFRQDADHIAQYLLDQEDHFYARYHDTVSGKLKTTRQLDATEVKIAQQVGFWYDTIEADGHLHTGKLEVGWHRGGLEQEERLRAINRFVLTRPVQVEEYGDEETPVDATIATKTLELGIDIGDVTTVINSSAPHTKNEYVQRVGRGGRRKSALAVTVIDPGYPLDYYFHDRFEEMITKPGGFEDAPIIVSNRSIRRSHLLARILDLWASEITTKTGYITVKDVGQWRAKDQNYQEIGLDSPTAYADALFEQLLLRPITLPGGTMTRLERLNAWFAKEADLLEVEQVSLSVAEVRELFREKIEEFARKSNPPTSVYKDADAVNGQRAVDRDFTPAMRGVGTQVELWAVKGDDIYKTDAVGRTRAVSSMPPHAFSTMGANTYEIDSIRDPDTEAERRLLTLLMESDESRHFFRTQFGEPVPAESDQVAKAISVHVPKKYQVKFRPNRFYCQRCGRTYTKLPFDERCEASDCKAELRQLTQVYQCLKCGEMYDPPVPRVCPNPECVQRHPQFMKEINRTSSKPPYELFKFWALPGLVWRCRECRTTFSYHNVSVFPQYRGQSLFGYLKGVESDDGAWTPQAVAKHYLFFPEAKSSSRENYDSKFHRARWKCAKTGCNGKLQARNVPVVRSLTEEYIASRRPLAEDKHHEEAHLQFRHVTVATLAREYFYRFYDPKDDVSLMRKPMDIWNPSDFLANIYDTHAAFLRFGEQLEQFLLRIDCEIRKCERCPHVEKVISPETSRPSPDAPDWLKDKDSQQPKQPAPWGDWGSGADEREFFRFVLVHTLKHSLMMALPKYTGVATSEVAGRVYPNNQRDHDLAIVDSTEDGSGAILLVRQRWNYIWEVSRNMAANALAGKGSLFLEYGCQHYNRNLCPALATWFYRYLETGELPPAVEV